MFKSILKNYQISVQGKVLVHILQKTLCQIKTVAHGSQERGSPWHSMGKCWVMCDKNRGGALGMLVMLFIDFGLIT